MTDPCVEKLSTGTWSAEQFRRHLVESGSPLTERVATGEVDVTFVDETADDYTTTRLAVAIGPTIGRTTIDTEFTAVPGTSFRVLTVRMRSDLRFSYVFIRQGRAAGIE